MKKSIYIFLLSFVLMCSCSQQGSKISSDSAKTVTSTAETSLNAVITQAQTTTSTTETTLTNISTQPQTTASTEYSSSKQEFLDYLHEKDPQIKMDRIDWNWRLPDEILEYGGNDIIKPSDRDLYILAYVYPVNDNSINIDEVVWVSYKEPKNEIMFEIINEKEEKINYEYADDAKIYTFFPGADVNYRLPISFLPRQIEIKHINLYSVYIENGRIKTMKEVYVP